MERQEFIDKLNEQIREGSNLLMMFSYLSPIQQLSQSGTITHYGFSPQSGNIVELLLKSELFKWEMAVNIILSSYWGQAHPQRVKMFKISEPGFCSDFKADGFNCILKNLTVLRCFVKGYSIVEDYDNTPDIGNEKVSPVENQLISEDATSSINISAVNASDGDGTIQTGDITGNELTQYVNSETKENLKHIIDKIEEEAKALNNEDILKYARYAKAELEKELCKNSIVTIFLMAIGFVDASVTNSAIQKLVFKGIVLVSFRLDMKMAELIAEWYAKYFGVQK